MKKVTLLVLFVLAIVVVPVSAQSYMDNQYQQLAQTYTALSQEAFDTGVYEDAVKYSLMAEEHAELSENYTAERLAKYEANTRITFAKNKIADAKKMRADVFYPMAFATGKNSLGSAEVAYSLKNWATATLYAEETLLALDGIKEVLPLPQYYIVTPWASSKDCYWNISGKPYIYDNPLLWENLYQANKDGMSDPNNPDLIHPGMKMFIPSLTGEFREGVYSPSITYDAYGAQSYTPQEASVTNYGQQIVTQ